MFLKRHSIKPFLYQQSKLQWHHSWDVDKSLLWKFSWKPSFSRVQLWHDPCFLYRKKKHCGVWMDYSSLSRLFQSPHGTSPSLSCCEGCSHFWKEQHFPWWDRGEGPPSPGLLGLKRWILNTVRGSFWRQHHVHVHAPSSLGGSFSGKTPVRPVPGAGRAVPPPWPRVLWYWRCHHCSLRHFLVMGKTKPQNQNGYFWLFLIRNF